MTVIPFWISLNVKSVTSLFVSMNPSYVYAD
eukprot:CAMPEP_0114432752 /NCGR_PEP_ID=MMETSP0103-20121206/11327_1 /TAXON_ID=37642 ORGANISM="Paraphysomonas imperforata, Strain PA2" /NCGR_SAMPLE_ID=MMETSP0103 /ASSEMBLY_ACC=CAM_ASM_000201 /LENGTH=30 /DNA_ID= /DNA_START= /DNA_END= /DNA_ORIENTATION=